MNSGNLSEELEILAKFNSGSLVSLDNIPLQTQHTPVTQVSLPLNGGLGTCTFCKVMKTE